MKKRTDPQRSRLTLAAAIVFICFIFSGMSGLIFEVAWSKALSLYLGNTMYAISTVVGAYMAGLGIGALIAGRFSGRLRHPIRTYGWIEGTVGLFGLASPFLFKLLYPIFRSLFFLQSASFAAFLLIRFIIIFLILLIPTIAMGMTLPVLVAALTSKRPEFGANVGKLYGLNTAGAVLGTLFGGFVLLPFLGLFKTIMGASALNLTILALIYLIPVMRNWYEEHPAGVSALPRASIAEQGGASFRRGSTILVLFAFSGFLAMVYEVGWTRVLSLVIGSSVYSFTIILATFLLGIALGSLAIARAAEKLKKPFLLFGILEVLLGITALGGTFLFLYLPGIFSSIIQSSKFNVKLIIPGEFLLSGLISFVPCFMMGLLFPVAACAYMKRESSPGTNIGRIYFFNTLGAIFGSILTGFCLIPYIGIQRTLIITSGLSVVIGIIAFFLSEIALRPKLLFAGLALSFTFFISVLVPPWNINRMNRGLIQIIRDIKQGDATGGIRKEGKILFYEEGRNATVAVSYLGTDMHLKIGGKIDASAVADASTQILLGELPMLYAKEPKDVCVIGLGSGVTTHSVLLHPVRSVETIEIENAVVEASKYFYSVNHDPLSDPRSKVILDDARNYLSYTKKKYDVIISEPSNPWIAGINNLFTAEFYRIINARLNDDGIFCQWLQTYELSGASLATIVKTFDSEFPGSDFFYIAKGGDSIIIAKKRNVSFDSKRLSEFFSNEAIRKDLARIAITNPFELAACYIAPLKEAVRGFDKGAYNTDDNSYIEYRAPIELLLPKERDYAIAVGRTFMDETKMKFFPDLPERDVFLGLGLAFSKMNDSTRTDLLLTRLKDRKYEREASLLIEDMRNKEEVQKRWKKAYETFRKAGDAFGKGEKESASTLVAEALGSAPELDDLAFNSSIMLLNLGKNSEAEKVLKEIIAREPFGFTYTSLLNLGSMYWNERRDDKAFEYYQKTIAYNPYFASGYIQIARAYAALGDKERARMNLQRALALEPSNEQAQELLASL